MSIAILQKTQFLPRVFSRVQSVSQKAWIRTGDCQVQQKPDSPSSLLTCLLNQTHSRTRTQHFRIFSCSPPHPGWAGTLDSRCKQTVRHCTLRHRRDSSVEEENHLAQDSSQLRSWQLPHVRTRHHPQLQSAHTRHYPPKQNRWDCLAFQAGNPCRE